NGNPSLQVTGTPSPQLSSNPSLQLSSNPSLQLSGNRSLQLSGNPSLHKAREAGGGIKPGAPAPGQRTTVFKPANAGVRNDRGHP
ncbi:MAG TPA: hypothetical protein VFI57_10340, partial [Pyrinomonadaceae bacterium]|nr:hypothetical protein [Pyrinomonadaceae bacterium]